MKSFCVIGLDKLGQTIAETLSADGKQVMIIDSDADRINALADSVTNAIIGEPSNETVLRAAGVSDYECAIVCIEDNITDNILLTLMLKEMGVGRVVARALNDGHKRVLERIGADMIIFPEKDTGERLAFTLSRDNVTDFIEFKGYQIAEIILPKKWVGKTLLQLDIRRKYRINVVAVTYPDGTISVSPSPDNVFEGNEKITVAGVDADIQACLKKLE